MIERLTVWFKGLPSHVKGMLILIPLLVLAIILSWDRVWEGIRKGFSFFSK